MLTSRKTMWPMALCFTMALAACGGGGGSDAPPASPPDIGQSVSALVDFINDLIARTDETSEPIDIEGLTLATDDTAEPSPL
ncbi:MAG: hypothetical protein ABIR55_19025 [Burkholderiaceae bacterium]